MLQHFSVVCSLDTEVEELREQEPVSRILAELLENWEEFFDTEDDLSTSNDYSSISEQVTIPGHSVIMSTNMYFYILFLSTAVQPSYLLFTMRGNRIRI